MTAELCRGSCCCRSGYSLAIYRPWQALPSPFRRVARWLIQLALDSVFAIVFGCFSRIKKLLGWTETQMSVDTNSLRHILRQWMNYLNYPARSRSRHRSTVTVRVQKIVFPDHNIPWDSQISVSIVRPVSLEKLPKSVRLTGNPWDLTRLVCVCVCLYPPPLFFFDKTWLQPNLARMCGLIRESFEPKTIWPTPPHIRAGSQGGVLGVQILKLLEISWTAEKIDSFCNPSSPPTREGEF